MKTNSKKDTVLITGASNGIGKEMAYEYARLKKDVVLVARSKEKLESIAQEIQNKYNVKAWVFVQDLIKTDAIDNLYNFTQENNIKITYLINNAGYGLWGEFHEIDLKSEENMLLLNILSLTKLTKKYITDMIKEKYGKIMNIASTGALNPVPFMAAYGASKAYVLSFTEAIASEYKKKGIQAMALCPGYTTTGFQDVASVHQAKYMERFSPATAEDVAKYAVKRLEKGKIVSIHQFSDRILDFLMRFLPRNMIRQTARSMMKSKN